MSRMIYGECVRGASHIRNEIECQDSIKYLQLNKDVTLITVADGHGSDSCPYSATGSKIAVDTFCDVMKNVTADYASNMEALLTYLNREGEINIAQAIDKEWKRRVFKKHKKKKEKLIDENGEPDKAAIYKKYGTTLLGMMITPTFVFAFQLGDGNIVYIDKAGVQAVIDGDKILGTETHSISKIGAWKKVISVVRKKDEPEGAPYLYLMSTDGFYNSFHTESDYETSCKGYFDLINEHGFSAVKDNLKSWLDETSALGSGDDISVMLAYYADTEVTAK